jgi:hypothetical protein
MEYQGRGGRPCPPEGAGVLPPPRQRLPQRHRGTERSLPLAIDSSVSLCLCGFQCGFSVARTRVDARGGASLRLDSRTTHPLHPWESPSGSATSSLIAPRTTTTETRRHSAIPSPAIDSLCLCDSVVVSSVFSGSDPCGRSGWRFPPARLQDHPSPPPLGVAVGKRHSLASAILVSGP